MYLTTRNFVGDNPNILFTHVDKGNEVVAMYKIEYVSKKEMMMLNDMDIYIQILQNPVNY